MYEDKYLPQLRSAANGNLDGALPNRQKRAKQLLEVHDHLDQGSRNKIIGWLANGLVTDLETALTTVNQEATRDNGRAIRRGRSGLVVR